jgi:hypothetical protein
MAPAESGGGWSLINLGELSKPATVLIEKISDAIGGIAKPWQMGRIAIAGARADIIRAKTRIEVSEMEERALARLVREQGKIQENIESIAGKAIPLLSETARPADVQNDWFAHIFDRCRLVSDDEMQCLWAHILAGETNNPGTFSKKTVDLVAAFDKADAQLFTKICTFSWKTDIESLLIYDENEVYTTAGISYPSIAHLEDMGLVKFESLGFATNGLPQEVMLSYGGRHIIIELPSGVYKSGVYSFNTGRVMFTQAGRQLASICESVKSEEYFKHVLQIWLNMGYVLSSHIVAQFNRSGPHAG